MGHVLDVLLATKHSGFPVLRTEDVLRTLPRLGSLAGHFQMLVLSRHSPFNATHTSLHRLAEPREPMSSQPHSPTAPQPHMSWWSAATCTHSSVLLHASSLLRRHAHFDPVITANHCQSGLVHRSHLCVLLKKGAFSTHQPTAVAGLAAECERAAVGGFSPRGRRPAMPQAAPVLSWQELEATYPRYPSAEDIVLSTADRCVQHY